MMMLSNVNRVDQDGFCDHGDQEFDDHAPEASDFGQCELDYVVNVDDLAY